ncbi:type IV secretory pathway VirB2 component (pilin) [Rhizobium mongolense]
MTSKSSLRPVAASALMAATIVACMVEPAFAQAAGIETVLQNIVDMLTGNIARLLAVIAVSSASPGCSATWICAVPATGSSASGGSSAPPNW